MEHKYLIDDDGPVCTSCGRYKRWHHYSKDKQKTIGHYTSCKPCSARQYTNLITNYAMFDPIRYIFPKMISEYHRPTRITRAEWFSWCGYTEKQLIDRITETLGDTSWYSAAINRFHLDHIKPRWLFDIEYFGDSEFRKCWALNNLRLIPSSVNRHKTANWTDENGVLHYSRKVA